MKLEVGMWVRIKNKAGWCCIGKIYNINDFREPSMKYCIDIQSDDFVFIPENMITKASHNIIDLIEVGDYVNGERVCAVEKYEEGKLTVLALFEDYCTQQNIKSIVTKEQFESMSYKVGD